ncbi:hypothetical protein ACU5P0_12490 [Pseudomonas plecoglossicida]|uniref:hypothetical protein n=1 Tax=Pseudomonas plecoglossicida TaxID=70775 RepID=UPI00200AD9E7|nr:hypothetical protein [Pseudomonas plecoglossicida]
MGAALGAALPSTRKEDQLMGATSDRLTDALKAKGEEVKDSLQQSLDRTEVEQATQARSKEDDADLSSGLGFTP